MGEAKRRKARMVYQHKDINPALAQAALANADAMDVVSDNDRDWFAANPDRNYRLRFASKPERVTHPYNPETPDNCKYVVIQQVEVGKRIRVLFDARRPYPENLDDEQCAQVFAEASGKAPVNIVQAVNKLMEI
jgi:hypothetical protein